MEENGKYGAASTEDGKQDLRTSTLASVKPLDLWLVDLKSAPKPLKNSDKIDWE